MTTETKFIPSAEAICTHAAQIVGGARAATHGDKALNHGKIAAVWNGILRAAGKAPAQPLDAHDVANLMEGLKIARRYLGAFNIDDYVDGAGYAACAGEIAAKRDAAKRVVLDPIAQLRTAWRAVTDERPRPLRAEQPAKRAKQAKPRKGKGQR